MYTEALECTCLTGECVGLEGCGCAGGADLVGAACANSPTNLGAAALLGELGGVFVAAARSPLAAARMASGCGCAGGAARDGAPGGGP